MIQQDEIENGRRVYKTFKDSLERSANLTDALENCGYEYFVWSDDKTHNGTATTHSINLIGTEATINVMVDVYHDSGKMILDEHFELISRENDDWDNLYYGIE